MPGSKQGRPGRYRVPAGPWQAGEGCQGPHIALIRGGERPERAIPRCTMPVAGGRAQKRVNEPASNHNLDPGSLRGSGAAHHDALQEVVGWNMKPLRDRTVRDVLEPWRRRTV
ncbi:hypothetical protein GWK47_037833 [Chionoecetes opilio]|uniref:Uncharacterized protein n=1 Tax=Chionoecetes opilio TaxID=41210 RepID=A0A8J5CME8_CHIOP|nr:hypothetical protein GWK47_037833 [Chionoecetes opilio]